MGKSPAQPRRRPAPTLPPEPVLVEVVDEEDYIPRPGRNGPIPTEDDDPSAFDTPPPVQQTEYRYPAPSPVKPLNRPTSLREVAKATRAQSKEPINSYLIRRSEAYREELPKFHGEVATLVREFFLNTVLPVSVGVNSGMADAFDVVGMTTSENPGSNPEVVAFKSLINHLVKTALRVKTASFISSLTELSSREDELFTLIDFATTQGGSNASVEEIMRKLFPVSDVPGRSKDDRGPLVRPVHPDKRSRKHLRTDPDEFVDSKGRKL